MMPAQAMPAPHGIISASLTSASPVESLLPVGASTCTLTFGPYVDALGVIQFVGVTGKLTPVDPGTGRPINLVHTTTGQVIIPAPLTITIASDGTASVGPIPHTDDPSLTPVGWAYSVTWDLGSRKPSPGDRIFYAPLSAGSSIDYDKLTTATALPIAATSDTAIAALLNDPTSATYARVNALITAHTGFGAGNP